MRVKFLWKGKTKVICRALLTLISVQAMCMQFVIGSIFVLNQQYYGLRFKLTLVLHRTQKLLTCTCQPRVSTHEPLLREHESHRGGAAGIKISRVATLVWPFHHVDLQAVY